MMYSFKKVFPRFSRAIREATEIAESLKNSDLRLFACDSLEDVRWGEETLFWRESVDDVLIEEEGHQLSSFRFIPGSGLNWLRVEAADSGFQAFYYAWDSSLDTTNWDLLRENGWCETEVDEKGLAFLVNDQPELAVGCEFQFQGEPGNYYLQETSCGWSPLGDALAINAHPEQAAEVLAAVQLEQQKELQLPDGLHNSDREYCWRVWQNYQVGLADLATLCEEVISSTAE